MATLTVDELFQDRDSESTLGGEGNEGVVSTYVRKFLVQSDVVIGPQTARLAPTIPAVGDPYQTSEESDPGALCHSVKATSRDDTRLVFIVTVSYSSSRRDVGALSKEIAGASDGQPGSGNNKSPNSKQQSSPEDASPKISTDYRIIPKVLEIDLDGKQAMNSSDEKFDPPIEYESLAPVIRVTRIVRRHDFNDAQNDVVTNKAPVQTKYGTAAIGTLLQVGIEVRDVNKNGETFVEETRTFFFNREGWKIKKLDVGFRTKTLDQNGQPRYQVIKVPAEGGGEIVTPTAVPLNGNGQRAALGGRAEVLTFRVHNEF